MYKLCKLNSSSKCIRPGVQNKPKPKLFLNLKIGQKMCCSNALIILKVKTCIGCTQLLLKK